MWLDEIKLGFGNSLIKGSYSEKLTPERIIEHIESNHMDIESYGLFDFTSPNYTTYYPDVTAGDLKPNDEEFIYPLFRALSAVIVHKQRNPVDFGIPGVLKASTKLLVGATVNPDHESHVVGNAIGSVRSTGWQEETKTDGGIIIPPGINAQFKIDGKSNPRIARGIMMDPPSIHSSSVTVAFMWDKSHNSYTDDEFFQKLGTYDKDGKMVRRMATKIKKYPEVSLVSHGADPFAQKINSNGQINNPRYAATSYNSVEEIKELKAQKLFFFDYKVDLIENADDPTIPGNSIDNKTQSDMNEFLIKLAGKLGVAIANLPEQQLQEAVTAALTVALTAQTNAQAEVTQLTAQHTTEAAEIVRLKVIETELIAFKAANPTADEVTRLKGFETRMLTDARTRITQIYNKVTLNKPDAAITSMIANSTDMNALMALETQYNSQLETMYPLKCNKCSSTSIARASAAVNPGATGGEHTKKSGAELVNSLIDSKKKAGNLKMPGYTTDAELAKK